MIEYRVVPSQPEAHIFSVALAIQEPEPEGQLITLPAWIPGSYMIRDFARHIVAISATSAGQTIELIKIDKQSWRCPPCSASIEIIYEVYAWDLSVRGAHLDSTHGYFNGTCLFLRVVGQEQQPCAVTIHPPEGEAYSTWRLATTLRPEADDHLRFGTFHAANYSDLIDHPVEMGNFVDASFESGKTPHQIVITGKHQCDYGRLTQDLKKICDSEIELFGELPDMSRYLFQVMAVGDGYGGLEHRSSTSLICKRSDLPQQGDSEVSNGYRQFLGLCSHEYFHLWNVKRITPKAFQECNLSAEAYSELLWAFEGITSYYDDLVLVRSGCISAESYLELLAQLITRVMRTPGRLRQTVGESSFDAWTKFYKQGENAPNAIISYYAKGALIALCLDLTIRQSSEGGKSLDDVMRRLWRDYGSQDIGLNEDDVEKIAAEETGIDLSAFFEMAIRTTDDLPIESMLAVVGVEMQFRYPCGKDDKGGVKNRKKSVESEPKPTLGVQHTVSGNDVKLSVVLDSGAAQISGMSAGDTLVAIDGIRVTPANVDHLIERMPLDRSVEVYLFRRDELLKLQVKATPSGKNTCDLWFTEDVSESVLRSRNDWLKTA